MVFIITWFLVGIIISYIAIWKDQIVNKLTNNTSIYIYISTIIGTLICILGGYFSLIQFILEIIPKWNIKCFTIEKNYYGNIKIN
jgi:hypothetical protein